MTPVNCVVALEASLAALRGRLGIDQGQPDVTPAPAGRIVLQSEWGGLKLGELRRALVGLPRQHVVQYDSPEGSGPATLDSYRGYYHDLALSVEAGAQLTVGELQDRLSQADGETFQGYKGGDYLMSDRTPVWASDYGESSGRFVRGVMACEDRVVLLTGREGE